MFKKFKIVQIKNKFSKTNNRLKKIFDRLMFREFSQFK